LIEKKWRRTMPANSLNLVDLIKGYLSDSVIGQMSSSMDESGEKTRLGINAAVPGLLAGFDRAASTPEGVRRINAAVDDADDSILGGLSGMFGRGFPTESGAGTLRSILGGGGLSDLAGSVGRFSGMSGRSVTSLLGMLAPVIFAVLRKVARSGSSYLDIPGLLANQRSNIAAAMPSGFQETSTTPRAVHRGVEEDTEVRHERRGSAWRWILPLALLAGALGLIWQVARHQPRQAAFRTPSTVEAGRERTALTLEELKNKYRSVLREAQTNGVQINELLLKDGKLWMRGTAPSQEAVDKVWSEIRRVNPGLTEINADFKVKPAARSSSVLPPAHDPSSSTDHGATAPSALPRVDESDTDANTYTVKRGDTLGSISEHFYGNRGDYKRILDANKNEIANQDFISPGQELTIPAK
jgi:LysM repeat protein